MGTTVETLRHMDLGDEWAEEEYMGCFQIFVKGVYIFSVDKEERT